MLTWPVVVGLMFLAGVLAFLVGGIVGRRRAERRLQSGEAKFRAVIDQAAHAVFLSARSDGTILDVNRAACDSLGYTRDELLAMRLSDWQADGRNLSFIIGGPDGVSAACRDRADFTWSLSNLTLPHGLARVMLAEQLYRAWSLQTGHPYHRS